MHYIIATLPRSRSAWLASTLYCQSIPCLHEGVSKGMDAYADWVKENPVSGNVDPSIAFFWRGIPFEYKLVIVRMDPMKSALSFHAAMKGRVDLTNVVKAVGTIDTQLGIWAKEHEHLLVKHRNLVDPETVAGIAEYVGVPVDLPRITMMQDLHVTTKSLDRLFK